MSMFWTVHAGTFKSKLWQLRTIKNRIYIYIYKSKCVFLFFPLLFICFTDSLKSSSFLSAATHCCFTLESLISLFTNVRHIPAWVFRPWQSWHKSFVLKILGIQSFPAFNSKTLCLLTFTPTRFHPHLCGSALTGFPLLFSFCVQRQTERQTSKHT